MQFEVGPWTYRVKLSGGLGEDAGRCVWVDKTIYIAADIDPSRRLEVLFHELRHAWQQTFGRAHDNEGDADQAAAFAIDTWRQLERQGGEAALIDLD